MTSQYNKVFHHIIIVGVIDIRVNIPKNARIITIETVSVYNSQIHLQYCMLGKKLELNYSRHVRMSEGQMSFKSYSICLLET